MFYKTSGENVIWGFHAGVCSVLVGTQKTMITLCSGQTRNWNANCVPVLRLRSICQACAGNHVQHLLLILLNWAKILHLSSWWTLNTLRRAKIMPGIGLKNGTETYSKICKYRKRLKKKNQVIYIYISFILNHVLHPAFFPHFTWCIYRLGMQNSYHARTSTFHIRKLLSFVRLNRSRLASQVQLHTYIQFAIQVFLFSISIQPLY